MIRVDDKERMDALIKKAAEEGMAAAVSSMENEGKDDNAPNIPPSLFSVVNINDYLEQGKQMEPAKVLFPHIIVENEVTIFFGDTSVGKSIEAVQMAEEVARQRKWVLYLNFEMSQRQWAQRYPDKKFPDTFIMANIDFSKMSDVSEQDSILKEAKRIILEKGIDVVFIDNLTNLCVNSKDGNEAGNIMLKLLSLRMAHKLTIVVLAHVPKRKPGDPLTLNDLAGSKLLSNLADNVVGINKSKKDKNMRYLIQLKSRSFPIELDSKNVQELVLTNSDGWLHFEYGGYSEETEHLPRSRDEKAELERDIVKELKAGLSYRDIADKLNTNSTFVWRVAKNNGFAKKSSKSSKS